MQASGLTSDDIVKDGTDAGFMRDVIEASRTQPVVVDFWAPWCGPCKTLAPALERSVRALGGKVKLVKVNIDEHPAVAGQLGVRSIPAVFAFDKGRPVDGFMGAVPESQLKLFLSRLMAGAPEEDGEGDVEDALALADRALEAGDIGAAAELYAAILQADGENLRAIVGLARCYLSIGETEQAEQTLALAPKDKENDPAVQSVRVSMALASEAKGAPDPAGLEPRIAANPADLQLRYDAAMGHVARGNLAGASDHLLHIISKDRSWNEDAARKLLLKIFEAAGPASDLAKNGRKRLSAILFS